MTHMQLETSLLKNRIEHFNYSMAGNLAVV